MNVAMRAEKLKDLAKEVARHNEKYNYPTTPKRKNKKKKESRN